MATNKGTSPWLYVGCGCAAFAGLCVMAIIALGFFGASMFQGYVEDMTDPEVRSERSQQILGTESLPEGYSALMFFRIPWILDMVILTDGPEMEAGEDLEDFSALDSEMVDDHFFLYFALRIDDPNDKDFDEMFEEGHRQGGVDLDVGSTFRSLEKIGEGAFDLDPGSLRYSAYHGELVTEDHERITGTYSQMKVNCPDARRVRFAVWFQREGAAAASTPADEATLREFMNHFAFCGG